APDQRREVRSAGADAGDGRLVAASRRRRPDHVVPRHAGCCRARARFAGIETTATIHLGHQMSGTSHGTGFREHALMFSRFLRSPNMIGAVAASSRTMARRMVAHLPADRPLRIVELGPGTGPFTNAIVQRVHPKSRILAIDREPKFVAWVCQRWPSVGWRCAAAVDLERMVAERQMAPLDHIISGLPFARLPDR